MSSKKNSVVSLLCLETWIRCSRAKSNLHHTKKLL